MESSSRRSRISRRRTAVTGSVLSGLIASIVAAVFLIDSPSGDLPGIALGSGAILVIERIVMLCTVWLLALVVIARALVGELPIEISGRGLRYADAGTAEKGLLDSEVAFKGLYGAIEELREAVAAIEKRNNAADLGRRYAMRDGDDDGN